jgi:hypothetical protein
MKILSSLKIRIYPKWFPNASAVTWSLVVVLQRKNLAKKFKNSKSVIILVVRLVSSPVLAECERFVHHGLGETQAKPPASGQPAMGRVTRLS